MLLVCFCTDTSTTEIYTLSLHDALPIFQDGRQVIAERPAGPGDRDARVLEDLVPLRDGERARGVEEVHGADVVAHEGVVVVRRPRLRRLEARVRPFVGEELLSRPRASLVAGGATGLRVVEDLPPALRGRARLVRGPHEAGDGGR